MASVNKKKEAPIMNEPVLDQDFEKVDIEVEEAPKKVEKPVESKKAKKVIGTVVGCGILNVRAAANASATILTQIPASTMVDILGEEGDFYKVSVNGLEGYTMKQFIKK